MPSLRSFELFLKRSFLRSCGSPFLIVTASAILFALFTFGLATSLRQEVSLEDQLDSSLQSSQDLKHLREQFPHDSNAALILVPKTGRFFSIPELCSAEKNLFQIVRSTPDVSDFLTPFDVRQARLDDGKLFYMSSLAEPRSAAPVVDPANFNPLERIRNSPWRGTLTDLGGRDFSLFLSIDSVDPPGKMGKFNLLAFEQLVGKAEHLLSHDFYWAGSGVQEYFTSQGMAQTQVLNLVMLALIWGCLRLFFGTWRAGAVLSATLFFTMSTVYGMMAWVGHALDPLAVCLFMMITVGSLEDFVFISYDQLRRGTSSQRSFLKLLVPSFFTSLTTVIGFGSLAVSDFSSISHFGIWAAFGAMIEWLTLFFILPAFGSVFPSALNWVACDRAYFGYGLSKWVGFSPQRWVAKTALIVFPLAVLSLVHLKMAQDPSAMFPKDHIFQKSLDYLRASRGWIAEASLTFPAVTTAEQKDWIIHAVEKNSSVARVERFSSVLDFVSQGLKTTELRGLVEREVLEAPAAKGFFASDGTERARVYLSTLDTDKLNLLRDAVKSICPEHECTIAGEFIAFSEFSRSFIRTLMQSLLVSLILVSLTLVYLAQSLKIEKIPLLIISSLWGPACMLACLPLVGTTINSVTCIVASTVVGLTGDNTIQYLFATRRGSMHRGVRKMGVASIYCSLMMTLVSSVLLYSYFEPPRDLGLLFALGFAASLVGDLWVLKGFIGRDRA